MVAKAIFALLGLAASLHAENALIECTADARFETAAGKTLILAFRVAAVQGWEVEKAAILLHFEKKSEVKPVTVALVTGSWRENSVSPPATRAPVPAEEKTKPDDWITIAIPKGMVQAMLDGTATGLAVNVQGQVFDIRQTLQFSPFLVIAGHPR